LTSEFWQTLGDALTKANRGAALPHACNGAA
jgi:hypothetical protein